MELGFEPRQSGSRAGLSSHGRLTNYPKLSAENATNCIMLVNFVGQGIEQG